MMKTLQPVFCAAMFLGLSSISSGAVFNFDTIASGTAMPFTSTVGGLTASVSGGGGVCKTTLLDFALQSGNSAITGYCSTGAGSTSSTTEIDIGFSQLLSGVFLDFALVVTDTLTLTAYSGASSVGTVSSSGSIIPGHGFFEGTLAFSAGNFDSIKLTTTTSQISIDNVDAAVARAAVPEPVSILLLGTGLLGLVVRSRSAARR